MTLTLAKELCGFDLLSNGKVLTCSANDLSAELKWACASPRLGVSLGNLEVRPGSCGDHLVFFVFFLA